MVSARRLVLLRLTAMAALCVSTMLTYDALHPERAFCPLVEACEKVRGSALGEIAGVPTSMIGMAAFGGLFLLTLLPVEWARRLLKPVGLVAALSGAGLFAYQALVIRTFCPLCLVADTAGLVAGLVTLTWGALPRRRSGRRLGGESAASRVAWTLAAVLSVVLPLAWPREEAPAWVEVEPPSGLFADEDAGEAPTPVEEARALPEAPARPPVPTATDVLPPPPALAPAARAPTRPAADPVPPPAVPPRASPPVAPSPAPSPASAPASAARTPAEVRPAAPAPAQVQIVEYLNAYCAHCRATHRRLAKVLADLGVTPRLRRVYTWAGADVPLWARACAFAQTVGREEALFEALLETSRGDARDIHAAAARVGLDRAALERALQDPALPPRLARDRDLFQAARLQGLPTLDIGRRRLMGEQSEQELRAAVEAARAAPPVGGR